MIFIIGYSILFDSKLYSGITQTEYMHNLARGTLAIGALSLVVGIIMYGMGASAAEIDIENDNQWSGKSGSVDFPAEDWWIVYTSESVDCESFELTLTDVNGTTGDPVWGEYFEKDCSSSDDDPEGFQSVGSWNSLAAEEGTYTVSATDKVYFVGAWEEVGEALGGGIMALCGGLPAMICGVCMLLSGGVLGIALKDKQNVQIVTQQPQVAMGVMGGQMVSANPMGAPTAVAPAAIAAPSANPAAMEYYNGLIAQGHDPANALAYTQQHFPGFQL